MRVYYGWYIVGIAVLMLMAVLGTTAGAYTLFVLPVSEAFDLTRADMNSGAILLNFGIAIASPFVGRILDLYSPRRVMAVSALLLGASLCALGLSQNIWLSAFLLTVPLAVAIVGAGMMTATVLVARWFTIHRGRAMAIMTMGMSLGTVLMVPLVTFLIEAVEWRYSLIVLGGALTVLILALAPFAREKPGPQDIEPGTKRGEERVQTDDERHASTTPLTVAQLLKMRSFWTISMSAALALGALQTVAVSLAPLAHYEGLSAAESASLFTILGAASIAGQLTLALLGNRLDRAQVLTTVSCLAAIACVAPLVGDGYATLVVCSLLMGFAGGTIMPSLLTLLADRFGVASFGTANGGAAVLNAVIGAVCLRGGGEAFDRTGDYNVMFMSFIAVCLTAAILMFMSGPPRPLATVAPARTE